MIQSSTMTKTTQLGTQRIPSQQVKWYYVRKNGVKLTYEHDARPAYDRRVGRKVTLSSHTGRDGRFRPCIHDQESYSVVPTQTLPANPDYQRVGPSASTDVVEGRIDGLIPDVHRQYYSQFTQAVDAVGVSLASVQWNALAATAINTMLPSFNGETSLANFIFELKDFKDVFKYLSTGFRKKLSRLQNFRVKDNLGNEKMVNIYRGDKPLEWMSKRYLEYSFGWLPLYKDVVALYKSISGFEATFREMVRRELQPQQRYWGTTIPGTASGPSVPFARTNAGPQGGWYSPANNLVRVYVDQEASSGIRYYATMRYRYKLPAELFAVGGKLKAYKDLLGINGNPAHLWNAIPFSFIIDWFINVNKYLERLKVDNIQIQTEILDFCHSARFEKVVSYSIGSETIIRDGSNGAVLRTPLATKKYDICKKISYKRLTGIPDFRTAILQSGLSLREFTLGGALLGARKGY